MKKPVPVEPLSEARYARIERELFERVEREGTAPVAEPRRDRRWIVVGVAAAAAIGGLLVLRPWATPTPVVASAPAPSHMTSEATPSHVTLGENELDLGPRTSVVSTGDDEHGVVLVLEDGSVSCHVAPRHGRPPFVVQAGDVRVTVKGTRFTVTRTGANVGVAVESGVVQVTGGGTSVDLTAGESWPPPAPIVTATATAPPASATATASAPPRASASVRSAPDAQARFEAAETLEATDPEAALTTYAALAKGSGPWAENALFAQGRLLFERGRKPDAQRVLREYVTRYPSGPNVADARAILTQIP
jgi:hypothetical protein